MANTKETTKKTTKAGAKTLAAKTKTVASATKVKKEKPVAKKQAVTKKAVKATATSSPKKAMKTGVKKAPVKKAVVAKAPDKKKVVKKVATKSSAATKKVAAPKAKPEVKKVIVAPKVTPVKEVKVEKDVAPVNNVEQKKIKVLYITAECQPFCATGGLADVAGSLPKYINNHSDVDIRVVVPLYAQIAPKFRDKFKYLGNKNVQLAWRSIYCGVFSYVLDNVTYYFLDNEHYFKRDGLYGYYDDGERFAFFSRAAIDIFDIINFVPDIIHCNEWQTALVPVYFKTNFAGNNTYNKIKTIFTLHNAEYQGEFDPKVIGDLFGIDGRNKSLLEYNKALNLAKGAICCCDRFVTVSPAYARELLTPEYSHGLNTILSQNTYKISGILNAIDYDFYNPKTDVNIAKNYDVNSFGSKADNKVALQKELGLQIDPNIPMMSIVTRMEKHKGLDLIKDGIESILNQNVQFVAVGGGNPKYEDFLRYLENKYRGKVKALLGYSNINARKAYAASDIFLMPSMSEPCGLSQMIASRYGAVPIVRETGGLKDSIRDFGCEGGGNGYTFFNYSTHDLVYSINRALNDYKDKKNWEEKVKICMNKDFSWKNTSNSYIDLYKDMVK